MGAKVQFDNYYSMRDLNHDSNATSWPLHREENNLPNGQYHYNVLPRPTPDIFPGADKELLKQKMLEHEAVFRSQVFELHRLYRVQKDLMDEMQKKEQNKHRTPFETSSSSSPLPSQMTREDVHRQNSSSFLFTNGVCGAPPVSDPEYIPSSTKGKSAECGPIVSQNCASTRNSLVSDARPSKLRKMIDLQLPAEEYLDTDEVEQCGNGMTNDTGDKSFPSPCENTKCALADLNEPLEPEETNCFQNQDLLSKATPSEAVSWKPDRGNINGTRNNSHYNDKGNGQNWFLSVSKPEGSKDNGKSYHHQPGIFPPKANGSFEMLDRSRSLSGFNNQEGHMTSHLQSYVPSSNMVKSWDVSWTNSSNYPNHPSTSAQKTSFLDSAGLSKSCQSSAPGNGFLEAWWCRNDRPRSNPGSGTETPVKNGLYHGSSSDVYKELHASFSRAGPDYVNSSYNDKATSGSNSFLNVTNSFDLNSTRDLNLNVPDCSSNELLAKGEDSVSVLPWLRAEATKNETANTSEDRSTLDHQNSVASTSCSAEKILGVPIFEARLCEEREKESEKKGVLFDINLPCDDPEEFENDDEDKIDTAHPNNAHRDMIDLNSCLMEDEIPSETSHTNSNMKKPERGIIIDLEAPVDLEDEEEENVNCLTDEDLPSSLEDLADISEKQLTRVAAEAIIDISTSAPPQPPNETPASENENALHWLADVACFFPDNDDVDCISSDSDSFEEMTLKLTECTVEEYFPNPPNFDALLAEEAGPAVNVTGRARRGPARRGRQRRDFQRDILPGLTSLARHEVTEDLQTFGGLMRATGHDWHCGTRRNSSGRGRRKAAVAAVAPPPSPAVNATDFSPRKQNQKNGEMMLEDRSLTSWGKTTRRPRRQRCPPVGAGNPAPMPLTLIT